MSSARLVIGLLVLTCACGTTPPRATQWVASEQAGDRDLLGVDFVDAAHGWAVGDITTESGTIYFSSDGGRSWRPIALSTEVLSCVSFVTPATGWAAGYAGRIQRTDDGGRTWAIQRSEREDEVYNAILFTDAAHGWVVGAAGLALRTLDGGATWVPVSLGRAEDLWAVRFASPDRGWIAGEDGLILATTDGGATWSAVPSGTTHALTGLAVGSTGVVVAVGDGPTVLRSEDGRVWTPIAVPTAETLNAVAAAGPFTFRAVGSGGACLSSRDGAITWSLDRTAASRTLLAVDTIDVEHAAAVGRRGTTQRIE